MIHKSVPNIGRAFGANSRYYPTLVQVGGKNVPALFTASQIQEAIERAEKNPEDVPDMRPWWKRWLLP